ncbi:MAG: aminotransferase class V-fold PLP-dependent enzyme, partial [Oscillospiraceae bacterium]|nr:aminotransferase class V-fold PLP-dependent enzyme [Oscillospiraceae bacterium]
VEVDYAEVIFGDMDATVRSFERLIKSNTKLIICTHASNVIGEIMPIAALGKLCRENNILFAVDAAQTAGIVPIDMINMNIDYLCVASHKGLYAPMGTGILVTRGEINNTIIEGGTGTDSIRTAQPSDLPEMLESGTINVPGIAGVSAGIDFVNSKGIENIYRNELKLAEYLYNKLRSMGGITVFTPYPKYMATVPTIAFNINGITSAEVAEILSDAGIAVRAGLHCAPLAHKRIGTLGVGTVRVCFSVFNNVKEIDTFVNYIFKIKQVKNS